MNATNVASKQPDAKGWEWPRLVIFLIVAAVVVLLILGLKQQYWADSSAPKDVVGAVQVPKASYAPSFTLGCMRENEEGAIGAYLADKGRIPEAIFVVSAGDCLSELIVLPLNYFVIHFEAKDAVYADKDGKLLLVDSSEPGKERSAPNQYPKEIRIQSSKRTLLVIHAKFQY